MSFFTALVTSKVAAGLLAGGTIAAGGAAAAAYTGTLPAPLQQSGHELIGAPAPADVPTAFPAIPDQKPDAAERGLGKAADAPGTDSEHGVGPDATGPAAFGLCTAFTRGGLDPASTAYKSLAAAADGKGGIAEYCKSVQAPGNSARHRPDNPGNPDKPDKQNKPDDQEGQGKPDADRSSNQGSSSQAHAVQTNNGATHKPASAGKP
ncbi:protein tyrosine phosphatase [Arthrobacter sp. MAHUQ-56]